ncbi:MAG TPA: PEP-CTERM sorting domain-containing protein [Gemmataceae bacterium]|jgi:hypothetical protein
MVRRNSLVRLFAIAIAAAAIAAPAQAGIIPASVTITPEAGNFQWTYSIVLPTDMKLQSGDYFTIYDFGGLVAGTNNQPADWTFSSAKAGPVPSGLNPTDDPSIDNLTWTYGGATIPTGQVGLGNFWAISSVGTSTTGSFTAQNPQASTGDLDRNIVNTLVPAVPGPSGGGSTVPEPATMALAGFGLPLLGVARLFRRKK